jgi:hypothetical protein
MNLIATAFITMRAAAIGFVAVTTMPTTEASAFSAGVKLSCASDYFAHCSQHSLGSPDLRQCMRNAGPKLSKRCVSALVSAGEVSQSEIDRRSASLR